MRLIVGCAHNGSIKEIVCNAGTDTSVQTAPQPLSVKSHLKEGAQATVCQMYTFDDKVVMARANGSVQLYKITKQAHQKKNVEPVENTNEANTSTPVPEPEFDVSQFEELSSLTNLLDDSRLEKVFQKSTKRTKIYDTFVSLSPVAGSTHDLLLACKSGLIYIISVEKDTIKQLSKHEVKAPLDFAQVYDNTKTESVVFAYGGEENLVKLAKLSKDYSELSQIWEAKNVANDRLDMRVPVWPTALRFLNPAKSTDKTDSNKLNYQFVVVTHWSHLGIYNTQHGRKPQQYIDLLPKREPLAHLTMCGSAEDITPAGNLGSDNISNFTFVTADLKKDILRFNSKGRLLNKYGKGDIVGSASFIQAVDGKYLLAGGLDRYCRVYDLESSRRIAKVYVTGKVNCISMLDDNEIVIPRPESQTKQAQKKKKKHQIENETEQDVEELWDHLEGSNKKAKK